MNKRMIAALISLTGVFVATYLLLYKLGYIGTLVCAVGSCEVVQTSKWAIFLGLPVAAWGVAYYVAMLGVALVGLTPALADSRALSRGMVLATATGVVFSFWLTYLELFVIHAICQWCVISAIIATYLFVVSWWDLREVSALEDEAATEAAARLRAAGWTAGIRNTEEVSIRAVRSED